MQNFNSKFKIPALVLACFVIFNFVFGAGVVKAQLPVVDVGLQGWEAYKAAQAVRKEGESKIEAVLATAAKVSIKNTLKYFSRKLAMDTATYLANKAAGRESLLFEEGFGNYLLNTTDAAAGVFLQNLSEQNGFAKFNFCQPDFVISLSISLGLQQYQYPEPPICTISELVKNWKDFVNNPRFMDHFVPYFSPYENDLGVSLGLQTKMIELISEQEKLAILERLPEKPMVDLTDPVTKKIKTPASWGWESVKSATGLAGSEVMTWTLDPIADAIDAFGNTFLAQYLQLTFQGLFSPSDTTGGLYNRYSGSTGRTTKSAQEYYASFIGTPKLKSSGEVDIYKLIACPENVSDAEQQNCVVDQQFFQAIREGKTVGEAVNEGLLHGDYFFGYKDPVGGTQTEQPDLENVYSIDNMRKLRSMRILPVGWELAAEVIKNETKKPTTLKEVIDGFNKYGDDDVCGTRNQCFIEATGALIGKTCISDSDCALNGVKCDIGESPFCNLVDSNWVLKAPKQRCDVTAYGATTVSQSSAREEICVDTKTCLREDEKGNCLAWGYCDRERNIWRFGGTECPAYYNSCEVFTDTEGGSVAYLENTINKDICNASNAGCSWYCDVADSQSLWSCTVKDADLGLASNKKLYFNKDVQSCDKSSAGCTELIRPAVGTGTNLLVNGSFEKFNGEVDDGKNDRVLDWEVVAGGPSSLKTEIISESYPGAGSYSLRVTKIGSTGYPLSQSVGYLRAGVPYMMSGWFKADRGVKIKIFAIYNESGNSGQITEVESAEGNGGWQNIESAEPFILTRNGQVDFRVAFVSGGSFIIDALKLEEATKITNYSEYGADNLVYIKKAPDYLKCDTNPDNPLCASYAPFCQAEEVGCELFTPTNGDPGVPGIVTSNDLCPASCIGYDMFLEHPTQFDVGAFDGSEDYFIPSTARGCTAVGCEEFTNLDTEKIEYFSELRLCEKPNGALPVFYTWEGSDQTGYQLKVWNLKAASSGAPLCVGRSINDTDIDCDCEDEYGENPDCRQFYDVNGGVHYRYYSKTITIADDCHPYRQTQRISQLECEALGANLTDSPIYFDANTQTCVYHGYPAESAICPAAEDGCREYKGNYAENIAVIFNDNFEAGIPAGWGAKGARSVLSADSLSVGGHSLLVSNTSTDGLYKDITGQIVTNKVYSLSFWAKGKGTVEVGFSDEMGRLGSSSFLFGTADLKPEWKLYSLGTVIFPAPEEGNKFYLMFKGLQSGADYYFDNIILKEVQERLLLVQDSWKTPAECDADNSGNYLPRAQVGCQGYFDRNGVAYNLKSFDKLCRESAVGCHEFIDTKNSEAGYAEVKNAVCWRPESNLSGDYLCQREGNNVCTIETGKVYCRYDIADPADPYEGLKTSDRCTLGSVCTQLNGCSCKKGGSNAISCWANKGETTCLPKGDAATVVVPRDNFVYLAENEKYSCSKQARGCKELGQPTIDIENKIAGWESTYLKDLPDSYNATLCEPRAVNCKEYKAKDKLLYFKDPGAKLCDYRIDENVTNENVAGKIQTGWFKKDTQEPCFGNYQLLKNADSKYDGWAGVCAEEYSGCEEFIDPVATTPSHPEGQPYYYLDNDKLDRSSCNGQVSLRDGCVLFNETSNPNIYWNAPMSYRTSEKNNNNLVNPVKYSTDNRFCATANQSAIFDGLPCSKDSDCQKQPGTTCQIIDSSNSSICRRKSDKTEGYIWFKNSQCNSDSDCRSVTGGFIEDKCLNFEQDIKNRSAANTILKVTRDRECAEWIDCTIGERIKDPTRNNQYRNVCYDIGRCIDLKENNGECAEWAQTECDTAADCLEGQECSNSRCAYPELTKEVYQQRSLTWSLAKDFSGYAIPGMKSAEGLAEVKSSVKYCVAGGIKKIGEPCDDNNDCGGEYENMSVSGQCESKYYLANYNDKILNESCEGLETLNASYQLVEGEDFATACVIDKSCRSYPDSSSPFDYKFKSTDSDAARCAESSITKAGLTFNTCDCSYQVANASGKKLYYPTGFQIPAYVCSVSGQACDPRSEEIICPVGEECVKVKDNSLKLGWKGYCLEYDNKKPGRCLTWYPIDVVEGEANLFSYNPAATYTHSGPEYYCESSDFSFAWGDKATPSEATVGLPKECENKDDINDRLFDWPEYAYDTTRIYDELWGIDSGSISGMWVELPRHLLGLYIVDAEAGGGSSTKILYKGDQPKLYKDQIASINIFISSSSHTSTGAMDFKEEDFDVCGEYLECLNGTDYDDKKGFEANNGDCMDLASETDFGTYGIAVAVKNVLSDENSWTYDISNDQGSVRIYADFANDSSLSSLTVEAYDKDGVGAFIIAGYEIKFRGGCSVLGRVAENGKNYAFTNNVNAKVKLSDLLDFKQDLDIDYLSNWQPWGGTNAYTKPIHNSEHPPLNTYVIKKTDTNCEYCGALYNDVSMKESRLSRDGEGINYESSLFWLFARIFEQWKFSDDNFTYNKPVLKELDTVLPIGQPKITGVKVNDVSGSQSKVEVNEFGKVSLSFYVFDPTGRGQLPIRDIKVDWGDESIQEVTSSFGNYADPDEVDILENKFVCDSSNWGRFPERCTNEPLEFFHIYRAKGIVDEGKPLCDEDPDDVNCRLCEIKISAKDNMADLAEFQNDVTPRETKVTAETMVRVCKKSK
ncbi:MAG: carbohydrate binding domain-containing protein [Patescibacteria group bacterium]|nr:carbohydrate binding domain-containing protein [Patescibacteria group bacterium]MDD5490259.1 carbohydrate binding domain-containing protein [Patescibacteria group bacterium]